MVHCLKVKGQSKETLERQLTIVPIDFTPLMNDPRFGLSWSLDD